MVRPADRTECRAKQERQRSGERCALQERPQRPGRFGDGNDGSFATGLFYQRTGQALLGEPRFFAERSESRRSGLASLRSDASVAMERERQAGNDEGQEKDRQDALPGASEGNGLAVGGVEGPDPT